MSTSTTRYEEKTPEGGVIRMQQWPEGYELWYHGMCVWRSWKEEYHVHSVTTRGNYEQRIKDNA